MKRKVIKNAGKSPGLAASADPLGRLCGQPALRQRLSPLSRLHDWGHAGNEGEGGDMSQCLKSVLVPQVQKPQKSYKFGSFEPCQLAPTIIAAVIDF